MAGKGKNWVVGNAKQSMMLTRVDLSSSLVIIDYLSGTCDWNQSQVSIIQRKFYGLERIGFGARL
jgi:hypothetical protein